MLGVFALFVLIYLADLISRGLIAKYGLLVPATVLTHPWQVLTTSLIHLKVSHLISTMFGLWFFGVPLEQQLGKRRTLVAMFGGATLGAIAVAGIGQFVFVGQVYLGWDSMWMAILGAYAVAFAATPLNFFGVMEIRSTTIAGLFILVRVVSDLENHDYLGVIGGITAAICAAALSGYAGRLMPLIRNYRDKRNKTKQRKGFVVIDGGKRPNEPRFWN